MVDFIRGACEIKLIYSKKKKYLFRETISFFERGISIFQSSRGWDISNDFEFFFLLIFWFNAILFEFSNIYIFLIHWSHTTSIDWPLDLDCSIFFDEKCYFLILNYSHSIMLYVIDITFGLTQWSYACMCMHFLRSFVLKCWCSVSS